MFIRKPSKTRRSSSADAKTVKLWLVNFDDRYGTDYMLFRTLVLAAKFAAGKTLYGGAVAPCETERSKKWLHRYPHRLCA
jgi:hypothetical protein